MTLNGLFSTLDIIPESEKVVSEITQFKIDYTFWMNLVFVWIAGWLLWQNRSYLKDHSMKMMDMEGGGVIKKVVVSLFILINLLGVAAFIFTTL